MKSYLIAGLLAGPAVLANPSDEALFQQTFEGMFNPPVMLPHVDVRAAEPLPPVPLDGGIVLLLAGGIAVARKRLAR